MAHVLSDPLPEGLFPPDEAAIVVFARTSTLMQPITQEIWAQLARYFTTKQIMEISFTVGLDQLVSRFHAAVRTDVDEVTLDEVAATCPVRLPPPPSETVADAETTPANA